MGRDVLLIALDLESYHMLSTHVSRDSILHHSRGVTQGIEYELSG
jgi:hypothetical protein